MSAENWRQLDGVEREFGVKALLSAVQPGPLCTDGFRMQCLKRFTDKTKIARAVKRCTKVGQPSPDSCIDVHTSRKSARNVECSRSSKTSDQPKRRNSNVLPEQCNICKGETYTKDSSSKKRQRAKISVCECTAGELEVN